MTFFFVCRVYIDRQEGESSIRKIMFTYHETIQFSHVVYKIKDRLPGRISSVEQALGRACECRHRKISITCFLGIHDITTLAYNEILEH